MMLLSGLAFLKAVDEAHNVSRLLRPAASASTVRLTRNSEQHFYTASDSFFWNSSVSIRIIPLFLSIYVGYLQKRIPAVFQ